jgi:hypothetical protein
LAIVGAGLDPAQDVGYIGISSRSVAVLESSTARELRQ